MKNKKDTTDIVNEEPNEEITLSKTFNLIIKGESFELDEEEVKELHNQLSKALITETDKTNTLTNEELIEKLEEFSRRNIPVIVGDSTYPKYPDHYFPTQPFGPKPFMWRGPDKQENKIH